MSCASDACPSGTIASRAECAWQGTGAGSGSWRRQLEQSRAATLLAYRPCGTAYASSVTLSPSCLGSGGWRCSLVSSGHLGSRRGKAQSLVVREQAQLARRGHRPQARTSFGPGRLASGEDTREETSRCVPVRVHGLAALRLPGPRSRNCRQRAVPSWVGTSWASSPLAQHTALHSTVNSIPPPMGSLPSSSLNSTLR